MSTQTAGDCRAAYARIQNTVCKVTWFLSTFYISGEFMKFDHMQVTLLYTVFAHGYTQFDTLLHFI